MAYWMVGAVDFWRSTPIIQNKKGGLEQGDSINKANVRDYLAEMEPETLGVPLAEITAVSEMLPRLTNADGTGLYWDPLRAIYEPQGIKIKTRIVPLKPVIITIAACYIFTFPGCFYRIIWILFTRITDSFTSAPFPK